MARKRRNPDEPEKEAKRARGAFACGQPERKVYESMPDLRRHEQEHAGKLFKCPHEGCAAAFDRNDVLSSHLTVHSDARPFNCEHKDCGMAFKTRSTLSKHEKTHNNDHPFVCGFSGCGRAFARRGTLENHTTTHYDDKPHFCEQPGCGRAFKTCAQLHNHNKTHAITGRRFACNVRGCGKSFKTRSCLAAHASTHSDLRCFVCKHLNCGKTFKTQKHLDVHTSIHMTPKRYACGYSGCEATFTQRGNLTTHMRSHTHERRFACSLCERSFVRRSVLEQHVLTHTGERPFLCPHEGCGSSFKQKTHLDQHQRTHTGAKPFACPVAGCDHRCATSGGLITHARTHSGLKPYVCQQPHCGHACTTSSALAVHTRRYHTKEGQQKKIRKQDRVRAVLSAAYAVDSECTIKYAMGCVPDPDKFCARVDFHIVGIIGPAVIVECDEHGHEDYLISCELTRMEQIHEAILKTHNADVAAFEGDTAPSMTPAPSVLFIRYNPHNRMVDGCPTKTTRAQKEDVLMQFVANVASGAFSLSETLNVVYINYDLEDGTPAVMLDPAYTAQMKACVRWWW